MTKAIIKVQKHGNGTEYRCNGACVAIIAPDTFHPDKFACTIANMRGHCNNATFGECTIFAESRLIEAYSLFGIDVEFEK